MSGNLVGVDKVARTLNLTPRRVQQLVQEGLPREAKGQYDLGKCTLWYIRYLQTRQAEGSIESGMSAKDRLVLAKAEREEYALAKERREMVTIEDYEAKMSEMITNARLNLLAIPSRIRAKHGDETAMDIETEIKRALRDLAGKR